MASITEFNTEQFRPEERLGAWTARASMIGGMEHSPLGDGKFDGSVRLVSLKDVKVGTFEVSANVAHWTHELIEHACDPFLRLIMQSDGEAEIEQGDTRFTLKEGNWALLNATRPHKIRARHRIRESVIIIPRSSIPPRLFESTRHTPLISSARNGTGKLLFELAHGIIEEIEPHRDSLDEYLSAAMIELVRSVIQELCDDREPSTCKDLRVERIKAYIERNLSDPDLSVQSIADAMSCSKRYIHALFAGSESIHSMIWKQRTQRCASDLRSRTMATRTITDIALSHGFNCPAHFSRMFKSQFALPPRLYREQALRN